MKPKSTLPHFLALAGSSLLAVSSHAAIRNWGGDTSATWATAGNWDTAPADSTATDIANFNLATYGGNPVFAPNAGTTSINGITIGAGNGAMTLSATNLTIGGSGITIANGAGALNVSGTVTVGATQIWTNNDNDTATLGTVAGNSALTLAGGNFRFNGNNTGTKNININSGTLEIGTAGKLYSPNFIQTPIVTVGAGAKLIANSWVYDQPGSIGTLDFGRARLVVNGGIIEVTGNSTGSGRNFTVGTGGATLRSSVNPGQTWTLTRDSNPLYHDIQVNSGRTLTLDGTGNGVIENTIVNTSGTGSITKAGAGTWTLSAANTYSGNTDVTAGTLLVNNATGSGTGSGSVTVGTNGTLGGNGTIAGPVTVDGTLKPGNSTGLLSVSSLTLNASSSTTLEINGTNRGAVSNGYDALSVNTGGSIDLSGSLSFVFGNIAAIANGTDFDLFSFTTTSTGDFASVSSTGFYTGTWAKTGDIWSLTDEGQTLNFSEVTGNLVVVPEPSAALLGAIGLLSLLRRRR